MLPPCDRRFELREARLGLPELRLRVLEALQLPLEIGIVRPEVKVTAAAEDESEDLSLARRFALEGLNDAG
ncbi:MAG TPA: hypothetical protein VFF86_05035, partial [Candidatus Methylomirabilis sp.]|nr:hypothetical protein [Candidatus Methylomirabilis sp.]